MLWEAVNSARPAGLRKGGSHSALTQSQLQGQEGDLVMRRSQALIPSHKRAHLEAPPEPYPRGADWQKATVTAVSNIAFSSVRSQAPGLGSSFAQPPRDSYLLALDLGRRKQAQ